MNNYNFTQSLDGLNNIEADSASISTLSNCNLVNCTTSTPPVINNSLVNKSYVDNNFVDLTTNQSINGLKLFLNKLEVYNTASNASLTLRVSSGTSQQSTISQNGSSLQFLNNSTTPTLTYLLSGATRLTISPTQMLLDSTCFLTTNDIKSRAPTSTHSLLSDITTGTLTISSSTATNTINGSTTFSSIPLCSTSATTGTHLTNKNYVDSNFMYKTGSVTENITGEKTFQSNTTFTGSNGYFIIHPNMSIGSFNPASETGTIGIIGLKDQVNDKFLLTLYGSIHASVKLNFSSGVSMGFGGGASPNTQVLCNGTNVVIKPSLQYSGDNTIQNSAFTGAGSLNGTYNLANMTIDTNGKITALSSGLNSNNIFTGEGTFNTWLNLKFRTRIYDLSSGVNYTQLYMINGNEFVIVPNANNDKISFYCKDSGGTQTNTFFSSSISNTSNAPFISNAQATFNTNAPISNVASTLNEHLTRKDYVDSNFIYKTNNVAESISGYKTFLNRVDLNGGTALVVGTGTSYFNGTAGFGSLATFNNGAVFNTSLPTSTLVPNNQYQLVNKTYVDSMPVHQILNTNNLWTGQNSYNTYLPTSTLTPSTGTHLTNKNYVDSNFMYKTGNVTENITGEKTFQSNTTFTGSNGYFIINPSMGNGFNPASSPGTIGIIGLKDQVNDNFLLTLYGTTHASVKLNFSSGVSMGFGGGASPNTQVLCNGTNVVIKPSLQYSGDNTIQNSAFTGAGSLNGTYNLANMTIDTNGKITALSSGLSSSNTFTGTNIFNAQATFNNGAVFNTVIPTTSITATTANELVNFTTLNAQSFIKSSSNTTFSGFNTFSNGLTINSTLNLKDVTNTQSGIIDMGGGGILVIASNNNSGKVQINTYDSGGSSYNRLFINDTECNITVPLTLNLDYTYYNPFNFNSTRLGYSMKNTGSTNTLTNNVGSNSGQVNIPAGSWNITYTATITVITNAITTLTSLEVFIADNFNADLNIIGLDVLNYYKISTVPVGQKIKISASGNYISYTNVNTELNLRLLPLFTAGTGGLTFQGSISATRNA